MEQSVISEMTTEEVRDRLDEERGLFVRMKLNHAVSPIENPVKIKATRRNIARLETELRKRNNEMASAEESNN